MHRRATSGTIIAVVILVGLFSSLTKLSLKDETSVSNRAFASPVLDYQNVTTHEGDLIISGTQNCAIENCTFIQKGKITVKESGKLSVKNATVRIEMDYWLQHEHLITDEGSLLIENSKITSISQNCILIAQGFSQVSIVSSQVDLTMFCEEHSRVHINGTEIFEFRMWFGKWTQALVSYSTVGRIVLAFDQITTGSIEDLRPGLHKHWNLHVNETVGDLQFDLTLENVEVDSWSLVLDSQSAWSVSNSVIETICPTFHDISARVDGLEPRFYDELSFGSLLFRNTSIALWQPRILQGANVTFERSTMHLVLHQDNEVTALDCRIVGVLTLDYFGRTCFDKSIVINDWTLVNSRFCIVGNLSLRTVQLKDWVSSSVARNYAIDIRDTSNNSLGNVELTLFDQSETALLHGFSDNWGTANFDITFADNNHTDTYVLRTFKEGFYNATMSINFLSSTPITINLTQKLVGDINEDRIVNILDISLVAYSFGCVPTDERWSNECDLNNDNIINIVDVSLVAKDYRKTA